MSMSAMYVKKISLHVVLVMTIIILRLMNVLSAKECNFLLIK